MDLTLIVVILFVIAVPLVMVGLVVGTQYLADRMVGDKHRLIQSIVETGRVPAQWKKPFQRRLSQARGNTAREAAIRQEAQAAYLQKLDALIRYLEHSKLVDSEETRQVVLERLAQVRETWSKGQEVY